MSLIKIDGKSYDIGEVEMKRGTEIIYDPVTQGLMLDFSEVDDAVATKYTYSFTIEAKYGVSNKHTQYDAFFEDITTPKSVRTVELPFGQGTIVFQAKIKTASDVLRRSCGGVNKWGGLSVTFLPVRPQKYSGF